MSVVINGTNGITNVNGTAAAPAITGTDTDTGMYFGTNTLALATGGTAAVTVDSSQNVGIGTSSPSYKLSVNGRISYNGAIGEGADTTLSSTSTTVKLAESATWTALAMYTGGTERARIDSSGNLLVGTTSNPTTNRINVSWDNSSYGGLRFSPSSATYNQSAVEFYNNGSTRVGYIFSNGSSTTYSTSSDYRLKNTVEPMINALDKVAALKPVTYKWNADDSDGQGFIAHELQAVVPECVTGEKDAVDADGNPVYQGIDTSFLVATLTAAIQEQQALITQLQADVAALKG